MDLFLQTSIFAGASAIKASAVQKWTRQNVQTLYLAWKEPKDTALLRLQKLKRIWGTWPSSVETRHLGGPAAACVGLAVAVSEWRGWLNLDLYQILPLRDRAFGRGTDRNPLSEKAQPNPVRHNILKRGSISLKHWESLTVAVWHLLWLLIYLNSPSVTKILNLKKKIKGKKKDLRICKIQSVFYGAD